MGDCESLQLKDTYYVVYDEEALKDLCGEGRSADCYVHFTGAFRCTHALIEVKGKKISVALTQLENTLKALRNKGNKVDEVYIFCSGISKRESKRYVVRNHVLYKREGRKTKPYKLLNRYRVFVYIRGGRK